MEQEITGNKAKKSNALFIILGILGVLVVCGVIAMAVAGTAIKKVFENKGVTVNTDGTTTYKGEDGQEVTVNNDGTNSTIKTSEGEVKTGENLPLPSGFPKNMPIYPGAKIVLSSATASGYALSLISKSSATSILSYYNTELPKKGWKSNGDFADVMISYSDGKNVVQIAVSDDTNGTSQITMSVLQDTSVAD